MTDAQLVLNNAIIPALALLPAGMNRDLRPTILMLAISGQEADFRHRWQVTNDPDVKGPARGLWQMERGGGALNGVFTLGQTMSYALRLSSLRGVANTLDARYAAVEVDDVYAAGLARLLLWSDPKPLPSVDDVEGMWQLYLRLWRPGAYTRGTPEQRAKLRRKWAGYYAEARLTVEEAQA